MTGIHASTDPESEALLEMLSGLVVTLGLTAKTRALVTERLSAGIPWESIAAEVGWDCETLRRHYGATP